MNYYYIGVVLCTFIAICADKFLTPNIRSKTIFIISSLGVLFFTYFAGKFDGKETDAALKKLTGNGTYPYAIIGGSTPETSQLIFGTRGEYALPEGITAVIYQYPNYNTLDVDNLGVSGIISEEINFGKFRKHDGRSRFIDILSDNTALRIYFQSDNNNWIEEMRIVNTPTGRKTIWYIKDENRNVLEKHIDEGFPVTENGEIVLWSNEIKSFDKI